MGNTGSGLLDADAAVHPAFASEVKHSFVNYREANQAEHAAGADTREENLEREARVRVGGAVGGNARAANRLSSCEELGNEAASANAGRKSSDCGRAKGSHVGKESDHRSIANDAGEGCDDDETEGGRPIGR